MAPKAATAEAPRGRGRPREFDEDEVLDALLQLFWDRGYEDASLVDIVASAGLNKSSLYNAFGSKDELFVRVLERYMEFRSATLAEAMAGDGGLDQLRTFFDLQRSEVQGPSGSQGCLAINATTELGPRDERVSLLANRYREILGSGLRGPLERAAAAGEIDEAMVDAYLDMLVASTVSIAVAARGGADSAELLRQIGSIERVVEGWRRA
jgi:AcrR family transcriptional regulator